MKDGTMAIIIFVVLSLACTALGYSVANLALSKQVIDCELEQNQLLAEYIEQGMELVNLKVDHYGYSIQIDGHDCGYLLQNGSYTNPVCGEWNK